MPDYSKNHVLALFKILINYTDEQHQISMQDILGYMEAEGHFCSEDSIVYYVGAKSKRISYPNACCMRKVVSFGDEIEYEELLPLMAVEFVRNNQYTVLPFPYKYLREYIKQKR